MAEHLMNISLGITLLLCAAQDMRKKKVFLWMIILGAVLVAVCVPFCHTYSLIDRLGGLAVGGGVVLISKLTQGKIGLGDGLLLCVTGIGLGFWGNLELFGVALFLASILAIFLLVFRMADRNKSFPFIPFMFIGYVVIYIANYLAAGKS